MFDTNKEKDEDMARTNRHHVTHTEAADLASMPIKSLTKQQFGKRLYKLMIEAGMNQSELAKAAKLSRNQISTYVRGTSFPTALSLKAIARVLKVDPDILLPNHMMSAVDDDLPMFAMTVSTADPKRAWLRINHMVLVETANKMKALLDADLAAQSIADDRKGDK